MRLSWGIDNNKRLLYNRYMKTTQRKGYSSSYTKQLTKEMWIAWNAGDKETANKLMVKILPNK